MSYTNILHEFFGTLAEELNLRMEAEGDTMTVYVYNARRFALKHFVEYLEEYGTNCTMYFEGYPALVDNSYDATVIIREG
jgi:hypothetical protein